LQFELIIKIMNIGIIVALDQEFEQLRQLIGNREEGKFGNNEG